MNITRLALTVAVASTLHCSQPPASPTAPVASAASTKTARPAPPDCGEGALLGPSTAKPTREQAAKQAVRHLDRCGLEEAIALTTELVAFPTVSAQQSPVDDPAFLQMAAFLKRYAAEAALRFRVFGANDVWQLELGEGKPWMAFVMHGDVVPVGEGSAAIAASGAAVEGWSHPPFQAKRDSGRLYGRGTEDDKGPIAAVLVAMRSLAALGWTPRRGKLIAVIGTAEESKWDGMKRYAAQQPAAPYTISLDASFPVVVAESGFVAWELRLPLDSKSPAPSDCLRADDVQGGKFLTQVPAKAVLRIVAGDKSESLSQALAAKIGAAQQQAWGLEIRHRAPHVELISRGRAVHSSVAERGNNAMWTLARAAQYLVNNGQLELCPGGVADMVRLLAERFDGDLWGQRLGLSYRHEVMGRLLVAPTVLRTEQGQVRLRVNMRRPAGKDSQRFSRELDAVVKRLQKRFPQLIEHRAARYVGEPALVSNDGALVPTLLGIYRELTGDHQSGPKSIRGGTYARLFPGAVSFGPALPGHDYRGHAPDEYISEYALSVTLRAVLQTVLRLDALP